MSIFGLPLILFQIGKKGRKLSETEFLSIKAHDEKTKDDEGVLSALGVLATLTAAGGKDMYVGIATVTFYSNTAAGAAAAGDEVVLKLNGVIKERAKITYVQDGLRVHTHIFKFRGFVTTGQIIELEVLTLDTQTDVVGTLLCYEEDTDASPQIPSI